MHARNALLDCLRRWLLAVAAACAGRRKARKYFAALCGLLQVPASELAAPADAGQAAAIRPACIHTHPAPSLSPLGADFIFCFLTLLVKDFHK